jgi:Fic family protein
MALICAIKMICSDLIMIQNTAGAERNYLSIIEHRSVYYRLLLGVTEKRNRTDWVMYILTAWIETTQATNRKIRKMLILKEGFEKRMKSLLGASFSNELLQLMCTSPYLTIALLGTNGQAYRQTASSWLKKLTDTDPVKPRKMRRTIYFVNQQLMDIPQGN